MALPMEVFQRQNTGSGREHDGASCPPFLGVQKQAVGVGRVNKTNFEFPFKVLRLSDKLI